MDHQQSGMFSYISAERRVPKDHPLRAIRVMVDAALEESSWPFDAVYASSGRPIAPEKLLRALLFQVLYTMRSERLLMKQLDYNFLFRWFAASERGQYTASTLRRAKKTQMATIGVNAD
jgi:transposase